MTGMQQTQERRRTSRLDSHSIEILDYLSRRPGVNAIEMAEDIGYWSMRQDVGLKYNTLMALERRGFVTVTEGSEPSSGHHYTAVRFEITAPGRFELTKFDVQQAIVPITTHQELISTLRAQATELEESLRRAL